MHSPLLTDYAQDKVVRMLATTDARVARGARRVTVLDLVAQLRAAAAALAGRHAGRSAGPALAAGDAAWRS